MALLPASANAASKGSAYPVITSVSPKKLGIGDVMTITGKNFRKGKNKNTVVFKRDGGRAVFVKAPDATTTKIGVTVPAKLLPFLLKKQGKRTFTRFRVRVLAKRFAQEVHHRGEVAHDRPRRRSAAAPRTTATATRSRTTTDTDDDNDLIPDTLEATLGTDPCKRDTDGDGESDGWEYYSALDRNGNAKPAPFAKALPEPAGRQGRRHRPRRRRPHRRPGVRGVGELRRQQAPAELQRRQPRLGRPRRPARRAWPTWTATTTAS